MVDRGSDESAEPKGSWVRHNATATMVGGFIVVKRNIRQGQKQ